MDKRICFVRLCKKAAVAEFPISCQPLCDQHIQADLAKAAQSESSIAYRIQHFKKYTKPLRLMQQRLASDLQLLDDAFNELRDAIDKCQKELVKVITNQHEELLDSLRMVAETEDFEKELRGAKDRNDSRQAYLINESMEKSLESLQLDNKLVWMDEESQEVKMVSYPDISSNIQDLISCTKSHISLIKLQLEALDKRNEKETSLTFKKLKQKIDLNSKAVCMTMCSNMSGFVIDNPGCISQINDASDSAKALPQPSVFVAVQSNDFNADHSESRGSPESKIYLLSPDAELRLALKCSWDSNQPIIDLHCDEMRQQLFLRDCDKLFLGVTLRDKEDVIFGVSKQSGEVQLQIPVTCVGSISGCRISEQNRMLRLRKQDEQFILCTITGQVVMSFKVGEVFFGCFKEEPSEASLIHSLILSPVEQLGSAGRISVCCTYLDLDICEGLVVWQSPQRCNVFTLTNGEMEMMSLFCSLSLGTI